MNEFTYVNRNLKFSHLQVQFELLCLVSFSHCDRPRVCE